MSPNILKRRSIRLADFDYSENSAYFVTICSSKHSPIFGEIVNGGMRLSPAGEIVTEEWLKTGEARTYVILDQFTVMPNHFHAILMIARVEGGTARRAPTVQRFGRLVAQSLPAIIGAFKAVATRRINMLRTDSEVSVWQRNYYEHVIRNETALNRMREYIINNPLSWELDRENPERRGEGEFYKWLASFKSRPKK